MRTFGYKSNMVIVSSEYEKRTEGGKFGDGIVLFAYDLRAPSPLMVVPVSSLMFKFDSVTFALLGLGRRSGLDCVLRCVVT